MACCLSGPGKAGIRTLETALQFYPTVPFRWPAKHFVFGGQRSKLDRHEEGTFRQTPHCVQRPAHVGRGFQSRQYPSTSRRFRDPVHRHIRPIGNLRKNCRTPSSQEADLLLSGSLPAFSVVLDRAPVCAAALVRSARLTRVTTKATVLVCKTSHGFLEPRYEQFRTRALFPFPRTPHVSQIPRNPRCRARPGAALTFPLFLLAFGSPAARGS